ncbi:sortase family protein [Clostridium sp. CAG:354]|nr:sortase family protein [Clostridium sp. CAG:354]HIT24001.1 class D sortase [Candidatus Faecimonas intestinavium]
MFKKKEKEKKEKEKNEKGKLSKKKKIIVSISILLIIIAITIMSVLLVNCFNNKDKDESIIDTNTMSITNTADDNQEEEQGVIAYLTIPSISLTNAPVKEGTDMDTLNNYLGHFTDSAYLEGNVAIAGHNRGYEKNYFENLDKVRQGDEITYQTKYQTKKYKVSEVKTIKDKDVYVIENTPENKITLITCVKNKGNLRLCVVGDEITE